MKNKSRYVAIPMIFIAVFLTGCIEVQNSSVLQDDNAAYQNADVTITVGGEEKTISDDLFGIFFEDINYAADGGLYPERIQNRSFEYSRGDNSDWNSLSFWKLLKDNSQSASVRVETSFPLNQNNPHYAVLTLNENGTHNGLSNGGFDGIVVTEGDKFDVSVFARIISGTPGQLVVRIEDSMGNSVGEAKFTMLSNEWTKYTATITAKESLTHSSFVLLATGTGELALDMISMFPRKTFRNRPNGLRPDLAQTIADLKPKFIRFPGGCVAHGDGLENMYRWKDTIGPLEQRKSQRNIWRYHQTYGLGYFEYFQFCEDIGAEPLPVVPAGVCCQNSGNYLNLVPKGQQGIPMDQMPEYVQEVLDLIEWANGPSDSEWGSIRAAAGHTKPFNLKYIGVGNEDEITDAFKIRYEMINDAIKTKYPDIIVIGTTGPFTDGHDYDLGWDFAKEHNLQMVDEHGYKSPAWFWQNLDRFDKYDRTGTLVYLGEYAAHDTGRVNTLRSALAEAAYMTSLERNGDLVALSSYAPLLSKQGRTQWRPDMIYFDNTTITPSVNYYVQQLFGVNCGDSYLPTQVQNSISSDTSDESVNTPNGIILGTWDTQVKFDDVKVVANSQTLLNDTFDSNSEGWIPLSGSWKVDSDQYCQLSSDKPSSARLPIQAIKTGYTVSVKAMKTSGSEGFLIGFNAADDQNFCWLNLGGWGNTEHRLQQTANGISNSFGPSVKGSIETGRWYNVRVDIKEQNVKCYLDDELIIDAVIPDVFPTPDVAASTVTDSATGDIIVKIVSKYDKALNCAVDLNAIGLFKPKATKTVLTGDYMASNEFGQAPVVKPVESQIQVSDDFQCQLPPYSFTVLRFCPLK